MAEARRRGGPANPNRCVHASPGTTSAISWPRSRTWPRIDLLMQMHAEHPDQGLDAAALEASERARASLLDAAEAGADIHQGADPQLLKREKLLQRLRARSEYQFQMLTVTTP